MEVVLTGVVRSLTGKTDERGEEIVTYGAQFVAGKVHMFEVAISRQAFETITGYLDADEPKG